MKSMKLFAHGILAGLILVCGLLAGPSVAAEGEPLAIRKWPGGQVTIETHWGLRLGVGYAENAAHGPMTLDAQLQVDGTYSHLLVREANVAQSQWLPAGDAKVGSKASKQNSIRVHTKKLTDRLCQVIEVDGVEIVVVNTASELLNEASGTTQLESLEGKTKQLRAVLLFAGDGNNAVPAGAAQAIAELQPDVVIPILPSEPKDTAVAELRELVQLDGVAVTLVPHNTLALSATTVSSQAQAPTQRLVLLSDQAWEMPAELEELFTAMETACSESQTVFGKLSVEQMNFKPANGTHTPRWNTEHMMGRQLLFFSQIYHELEPSIPVMDLNPQQMPPDYEFAHADWDGAEEARQMQRVSDFTRRFAYLLADCPLDERAPGSRWPTLKALLQQMQRHYAEHTANTVKKFELPDWPGQ